ncbi:unnamed protein product [Merluccius merluccius]
MELLETAGSATQPTSAGGPGGRPEDQSRTQSISLQPTANAIAFNTIIIFNTMITTTTAIIITTIVIIFIIIFTTTIIMVNRPNHMMNVNPNPNPVQFSSTCAPPVECSLQCLAQGPQ